MIHFVLVYTLRTTANQAVKKKISLIGPLNYCFSYLALTVFDHITRDLCSNKVQTAQNTTNEVSLEYSPSHHNFCFLNGTVRTRL